MTTKIIELRESMIDGYLNWLAFNASDPIKATGLNVSLWNKNSITIAFRVVSIHNSDLHKNK